MAFCCCFGLQWVPNFRDHHNYSYLSCFDHWWCVLCSSRILILDAYTSCILHWSSVGHAFIFMLLCFIDCMFGWSFTLLYDHCDHFHMTVMCLIKLFICFTTCLLDRILLVTLYLSFYHLIYLEGLMCFVQVFQATGIYVPSATQLLDLGVSEFCHCSQTHV